jgi:ATP-dependent Lon protease
MGLSMSTDRASWIPAMVSSQFVLFPSTAMPVTVTDVRNLSALREMKKRGLKTIYIATKKDADQETSLDNIYSAMCLAEVEFMKGNDQEELQLIVRGLSRQSVQDLAWEGEGVLLSGEAIDVRYDCDQGTQQAYLDGIKELAEQIMSYLPGNLKQIADMLRAIEDPELLVNLIAPHLEVSVEQKIELLNEESTSRRLMHALETMQEMKQNVMLRAEIGRKVSHRFSKQHRDAVLRQQLKVIQEELGEQANQPHSSYLKRIEDHTDLPPEVRKIALDEAQRLATMDRHSPEVPGIQSYLDLILTLPWKATPKAEIELKKAREILNSHHYGLDKVKDRIVQHLAVLKLKDNFRGSILLLVGPPGVGKTSLGRSIAEAMGREFVRASLGGVRDEAEIRGHRRTYIGSRPGRIIQALKSCKSNNPVFLLDELDKLNSGITGDPAAALLEVLDPEQNNSFRDHYLEVPYDLSQVMFIATANSLETIPGPLRDRMEIISISGYTTAEKLHIAKQHLWPEALEHHGVKQSQLSLAEDALLHVITHYTREAGVRDLKRKLATLIRGSTEDILQAEGQVIQLKTGDLERRLGTEPYTLELAQTHMPPGVVTGLAWTPMGGEILFVEAKAMPGKGQLVLTGQMGDVMKESVQIAMTHVRSLISVLGSRFDFDKTDVHVHVPAGAIPKDGPSAGVTMLTALASLFSQRSVNPTLAMTGEITLRGAVTAVGGVKEKVLAAHRAGIKTVLLSERNRKDIHEVPEEVRQDMHFLFVYTVADVIRAAIGLELQESPQPTQDQSSPQQANMF